MWAWLQIAAGLVRRHLRGGGPPGSFGQGPRKKGPGHRRFQGNCYRTPARAKERFFFPLGAGFGAAGGKGIRPQRAAFFLGLRTAGFT